MSDMNEAPTMEDAAVEAETGKEFPEPAEAANYRLLADIPVRLSVEVGSVSLKIAKIMELSEGQVVELDREADALLDIKVNGTLVAKGEVVTVNDRFGIRVVEVVTNNVSHARLERRS